jgi:hypothetical protein
VSHRTRREWLCLTGTAGIISIAGCSGQTPDANISQTRVVYKETSVGVLIQFDDDKPARESGVTVHVELLSDGETIIAEQTRRISPVTENTTYAVWFTEISDTPQTSIQKVSASVE